jgi:serine/threonine protein kinase
VSEAIARLTTALSDRYRIERELGAGGMATVYLAEDLKHDRKVAIKVLRPELAAVIGAERFLKEIKTTANLQHPHILGLIDSGSSDGLLWYAMPFVDGESLRDRLNREKQLPVSDAVRIATEAASALDYAHRHGVIHRVIKPENILLHDGSALVADFGIALAASTAGTRMTETGMSLGTPHYMSPEQAMGEREITARSDVYALGCITYEMLVGEPPFNGPTAQAIIARVMTEEPRSLTLQRKSIPPQVEAAVLTALEKLPADRFASTARFADALGASGAAITFATTATPRAVARRERRWLALVPWAVAVLGLAVGGSAWFHRSSRAETHWLSVTLSDSLGLSPIGNPLAFSPDGRTLVFRDDRQNGKLWIKRQGQLDPVSMPGTEKSISPVFSPDGQWIAFIADGTLKKVRVAGGAAVTLADSAAPPGYGLAWLDDGTIILPSLIGDRFRRVGPDGGPATVVLADSAMRGLGLLNANAIPHARGVFFVACTSGCVTNTLQVLDLRTGRHKVLVPDGIAGWYLPTGHLLYVRKDGSALVAPFDLNRLEITGPAIPVFDGVLVIGGVPRLAVAPTGSLIYVHDNGASNTVEMARVTRTGLASPIDTSWFGAFNSSALSPDGRRLAVGAALSSSGLSVWIKQLPNGPFSRLSFGGQDRRPTWSTDGRLVAFIRDTISGSSVYVRPVDGSGTERLLARIDRSAQEVTWSGDGKWLVLRTDNGAAGAGDLVGIRTSGDTAPVPLVVTPFTELHPAVSHDAHWLAYTSNESGTNEVYVRPFPETGGGRWQVSNGGGMQPAWAPDGRTLYFIDGGGRLIAAEIRTTPGFEVMRSVPLFSVVPFVIDQFHTSYSVMPDGSSFIFAQPHSVGRPATGSHAVLAENWFADMRTRLKR